VGALSLLRATRDSRFEWSSATRRAVSELGQRRSRDQTLAREQIAPTRRHIEERLELERPAILLVGHEPAIGWLLDGIDQPISLVAGEVVCLAREASTRDEWHVWWMLTPSKAAAIDQLREKIESKMTLLSVLAGFTLAVTGQVLIDLPKETGPRLLASGAAVCFVVAAATYFCTLLAYDQLMMPPRFWRGGAPAATPRGPLGPGVVARPPSSAGIVLFQQMTAVWKWVIGALVITGAGVVLLGLSKAWTNGAAASLAVVGRPASSRRGLPSAGRRCDRAWGPRTEGRRTRARKHDREVHAPRRRLGIHEPGREIGSSLVARRGSPRPELLWNILSVQRFSRG